jgi:hypothetical protein
MTTDSQPSSGERPKQVQWRLFVSPNGGLSVARLHIGLGIIYLISSFVDAFVSTFARRATTDAANANGPPGWTVMIGVIILIVGGLALVLEARLEHVPASWPARSKRPPRAGWVRPYWFDIAVLQLGLLLVPAFVLSAQPMVAAWRIVAIVVASELVYLAFLGVRLVQKEELSEVLRAIEEVKARAALADKDQSKTPEERVAERKAEEEKIRTLEIRAAFLMEQIDLTLSRHMAQNDMVFRDPITHP